MNYAALIWMVCMTLVFHKIPGFAKDSIVGLWMAPQVGFDKDVTSMNRFGIRLAAGAAVVCLGGLAILQAQRDKNDQLGDDWPVPTDVASMEPPAPLGIASDWPALPDEQPQTLVRGNGYPADFNESIGVPGESTAYTPPYSESAANQQAAFSVPSNSDPANGPALGLMAGEPGAIRLASYDEPQGPQDSESLDVASETQPAPPSYQPPTASFFQPPLQDSSAPEASPRDVAGTPATPAYTPTPASPAFTAPAVAGQGEADTAFASPLLTPLENDAPIAADAGFPAPLGSPAAGAAGTEATANQIASEMRLTQVPPQNEQPAQYQPPTQPEAMQGADGYVDSMPPIGSGYAPPANPTADYATVPAVTTPQSLNDPLQRAAADWQSPAVDPPSLPTAGTPTGAAPAGTAFDGQPSRLARSQPQPSSGSNSGGFGQVQPASQLQTIDVSEILSQPGTRDLEGVQTPSVVVQKRAPAEIRVGKPAEFVISVKNVGTVPALDVRVFDTLPQGAKLDSTLPPAEMVQDLMVWQLGDLRPSEERSITISIVPLEEGEIGSVARVTFEAAASVRTLVTRPNVELLHSGPPQVLIGQQYEVDLVIKNSGSGTADNVVVLAELPEGLETPNGRSLKLPIGPMPPGDTRKHLLRMRATKPGPLSAQFRLSDSDGLINEVDVNVQVIAPQLEVALQGPSMRYLERQATYKVQIANTGTADASDIDLVVYLDRGLKFVSTEFEGTYDPARHAVFWALDELRASEVGEVPLTLLPVEAGVQKVRVETTGALGISGKFERELTIETLAELTFSIADDQDPIEPGADTTYVIRVRNTGSRDDTNVVLALQIPSPGLEVVTAEPSAGSDGKGKVIFEPIARIPAKGEQVYRVRVRGVTADTHVVRATLVSAESKRPVTKEESTTVYEDR
jgi:uncharacterized repeat protein (TIGR01451 family)